MSAGLCLQPSFSSVARLQLRAPRRARPRHLTPPVCVQSGVAPAASAAGSGSGSAVVRQAELAQLRDPAKASGEGTTSITVQVGETAGAAAHGAGVLHLAHL